MVLRQTQLYKFLSLCEQSKLTKNILDCGAGGSSPPLYLFHKHGYETFGIEIDDNQLSSANEFSKEHGVSLNIVKGDMRILPFDDESISFVYSYHSIFHMTKDDIAKSVNELLRVLKPDGLCYVDFLSVDDFMYNTGEKLGDGEFLQGDEEGRIHTYFNINEGEKLFSNVEIIYKEHKIITRPYQGKMITQSFIDYIIKKPK
jgi:ubiquinone/menaquinone biosynthesis C-methylase UbiE